MKVYKFPSDRGQVFVPSNGKIIIQLTEEAADALISALESNDNKWGLAEDTRRLYQALDLVLDEM